MNAMKPFYQHEESGKLLSEYLKKYETLYYTRKFREIKKLFNGIDLPGKKVLDIGCCAGYISVWLAGNNANVVGIDISKNAVEAAKKHAKIRKVSGRCEFYNKDIIKEDLKNVINGRFDIVIAKDVIEHIKDDGLFLKKIHDLLKDGGILVLTTQNNHSFNYFLEGFFRKISGNLSGRKWLGWDPTHLRWYNKPDLNRKLKEAGFKPEKYSGSYYFPYEIFNKIFGTDINFWPFVMIDDLLGDRWPFNRLGWSISVRAGK